MYYIPLENQIGWRTSHLVEWFPVQRTHRVDFQVVMNANVAESVAARSIQRLDKRLKANLAHEILIHFTDIIVEVRLVMRMMLTALATHT